MWGAGSANLMRKIVLFTDFWGAASAVPGHDGDLTIGHRSSNLPTKKNRHFFLPSAFPAFAAAYNNNHDPVPLNFRAHRVSIRHFGPCGANSEKNEKQS